MSVIESWEDIVGFEGRYRVSEFGVVKSLERTAIDKTGFRPVKERILIPSEDEWGYYWYTLCKDGFRKCKSAHVIVLEAFIGPRPKGLFARHLDSNPKNNHPSNLKWDTLKTNMADKIANGSTNRGENCGNVRLTVKVVQHARELYAIGDYSKRQVAKILGYPYATILAALNNESWVNLPDCIKRRSGAHGSN